LTCFSVAPRYLAVPAQPTGVPMAVQRDGNQTNFEWETFPAADDTTAESWNDAVQELVTKANADVYDEANYIQASPTRVNRIPETESGEDEVISNAPLWWTLTSRDPFAKIQNFEGPRVNIRIHRVVHQPGSSSWVWVTHRLRFVHESIPFDWTYSAAVDQTESALDSLRAQLISSFPTWKELQSERGSLAFALPGRDLYPSGYPNGVETAGGVAISYGKHFLGDDHSTEKSWAKELLNLTLSKSLQDLKLETFAQVTAERGPAWKLLLGAAFQFLEDGKFVPTDTHEGSTVAIGPGLVVQPEATRCIVRLWAQPAGQTQWVLDHEFGVQDLRNAKMFRVKTAGLGRMYLEVLATDGWMVADLAPSEA
ncbi:MAG: hypothetical protein KGR25_13105, partial [Chloroflexi bacterium]|nr:hypothetical protein [Chloroflexota bacterium]